MKCKNPENHENHICRMKINQLFDEVKKLGREASHFCKHCDAHSNNPEHLCLPQAYEGTPGILKWKM